MNEKLNIAYRVDASAQMGSGHFMRCLTLANALKQRGTRTRFVSRNLPEYMRSMLAAKGHEFALLDNVYHAATPDELAHANWLGISQAQDAADSIQALSDEIWDWLIVDHYALDSRWESVFRQAAGKILVIDDLADRQHDCDILIDQNFYADMESRYIGKVPAHCQMLLGPRYALLRDEFRQLHQQLKPRNGPVKHVLVFFGGMDADNYTGRAIEALSGMDVSDLHINVVIGAQHPDREQIEADCARRGYTCHVQTDRMAELMAAADLAIGAGGSATWERCCLGLPTLSICLADNQRRQIADAARDGLLYSPEIHDDLMQTIQRHVGALIENSYLRHLVSRNGMQAVDGRGVARVMAKISDSKISGQGVDVRLAVAGDAELVWPWRNDESTRRYFFDSAPVSLEVHLAWWIRSLSDPQRVLLLGRLDEKEVGVIRFDFVDLRQAKVSIYLNPEMTGRGVGKSLLRAGQDWLLQKHPEIDNVIAEVMPNNIASLRAFLGAGFKEHHLVLSWK